MRSEAHLLEMIPQGLINQEVEPTLFIRKVQVGGKEKTFLATSFAGYVFSTKFFSKSLVLQFSFSWDTVKRISSSNADTLSLFYHSGEFMFSSKDAPNMAQAIIINLKSIFTPSELPNFALDDSFPLTNQFLQFPMVSRFRFKTRLFGRRLIPSIMNALREFTLYARKQESKNKYVEFDISQVPSYLREADLILDALEIDPQIKNLSIPATGDKTFWAKVANYFRKNTTICSIVCKDAITNDFQPFITALSENTHSSLNSFSFVDTGFEENAVHVIPDLISAHQIDNLTIQNSMNAELFQKLIPMFPTTPAFGTLQVLNLRKSKGANPAHVLQYMLNLRRLDCSYCDIDVSDIFLEMSNLPKLKLKDLSADGNLCIKQLKFNMKFSKRLTSIQMKGCTWAKSNLTCLIQLLCKKKRQNKLTAVNFSNAKLEPAAWRRFFKKIPRINFVNLGCFIWNSNPIHQNIFKLLQASKSLDTLSLSGCIDGSDENFGFLIDFLMQNTTLRKLVIAGSGSKKLRESAQYIFEAMESLQISILDISNNDIGDNLFPLISHLITVNPNATDFYIDDNKFEDVKEFENFIGQMKSRGTRLGIEIPKNDLTMISTKNRSIRKKRLSDIIQEIIAIGKLPKRRKAPPPKRNLDNGPLTLRVPRKTAQVPAAAIENGPLSQRPPKKLDPIGNLGSPSVISPLQRANDQVEAFSDDEYEYYYSDVEEQQQSPDVDWAIVGESDWDNALAKFLGDDQWAKNIESTPLPNKKESIDASKEEFSLENLMLALNC